MIFEAVIEIPKGSDRRTHMAYDKSGFIDLGPIKDRIPVNNGVCPVHYGFIEGTFNKDDGDEVDVLVFSKNDYKTGDVVEVNIEGILKREDGDHKIIASDNTLENFIFDELPESEKKIILDYMGYMAKISSVEPRAQAVEYIESSIKK